MELLDNGIGIGFVLGLEPSIKVLTEVLSAAAQVTRYKKGREEKHTWMRRRRAG